MPQTKNNNEFLRSMGYEGYTLELYRINAVYTNRYKILIKIENKLFHSTEKNTPNNAITAAKVWVDDQIINRKAGCNMTGF